MTTAITNTATIIGIDDHVIEVEADVSIGLGHFSIVGLPDGAIKESRDLSFLISPRKHHYLNTSPIWKRPCILKSLNISTSTMSGARRLSNGHWRLPPAGNIMS